MSKTILRAFANFIIAVGLFLLIRLLYSASTGTLIPHELDKFQESWANTLYALFLSFPIPFHVISIGLVLQLRWLEPPWAKAAWLAAVISGCWLGVAIGIRVLVL